MNSIPSTPEPLEADPAYEHPSWCFSGTCSAPDRLLERGVAERDVPIHRRSTHFSQAHVIPITRVSEVEITLELHRDVYQPVTDEPDGAVLSYHAEYCGHSGTLNLAGEQMAPLATAFSSLRDAFRTDRNPVLDEVAQALRVLGCRTRTNAEALLSLTVVHLTDRERAAVLESFPQVGGE